MPPALRPLSGDFAIGDAIPEHVHTVPACQRRLTPALHAPHAAEPVLAQAVETIAASVEASLRVLWPTMLTYDAAQAVRAGIANGVTAASEELAGEAGRLRAELDSIAELLDPPGAPACYAISHDRARQIASYIRDRQPVDDEVTALQRRARQAIAITRALTDGGMDRAEAKRVAVIAVATMEGRP